ncbi:MAG: RNA methyltransferase [Candidatus Dormibacteria bacterium]
MPVLEALRNPAVAVDKVLLADTATGAAVEVLLDAARERGIAVRRVPAFRVTHLSGNGRQDQGVVADIRAPQMGTLTAWLARLGDSPDQRVLLLDRVANPANLGMVLRTATASGMNAVVVPRKGSPEISSLVIKASAGVALEAVILRESDPAQAASRLGEAGFRLYGLRAGHDRSLWDAALSDRAAFVIGGETEGISDAVATQVDQWLNIPLAGGVESLNVSSAAAVLCFEVLRRRREHTGG